MADPHDFDDPLQNYDPAEYADALERALAEQTAAAIQSTPYASVAPDTPVGEALQRLAGLQVACLVVESEGKLAGLFSDRNVLDNVALEFDAVKDLPVSAVMASDPVFVYDTDSAAAVLHVMAVSGHRHVPVVRRDRSIVGIVSPQRITQFLKQHFEA